MWLGAGGVDLNGLNHDPHDLIKKGIVLQGYLCVLDPKQPGNRPKAELCSLSDKV
jgi:hypothetical protein